MQTKKMNLANMQGMLSRAEMKKIMAGNSPSECVEAGGECGSSKKCCNGTCPNDGEGLFYCPKSSEENFV